MRRRPRRAIYACALLALLTASCGSGDDEPAGTLEAESGRGQTTIEAGDLNPPHQPITFGAMRMCVKGGPVTITRVTVRSSIRPEKLTTAVWVVDQSDDADVIGIGSYNGTPQQYLAEGNPGALHPTKGFRVSKTCPDKQTSFVDLLVTAQASERGAKFSKVAIHYTSGGKERTVTFDWTYLFCGTATASDPDCRRLTS